MRHLRRIYQRPDGGISIIIPAWDDRFSPFSPQMAPVRAAYEEADANGRKAIWVQHLNWTALFPFDPFTVTEGEFYEWSVTRACPADWVSLGDCPVSDLPPDREFRAQWRHDGKKVYVDPALETAERWVRIRKERNQLLSDSDGPMARANEQGSKVQEWKTYRQALRDVPAQADPRSIEWPVKPHNVP